MDLDRSPARTTGTKRTADHPDRLPSSSTPRMISPNSRPYIPAPYQPSGQSVQMRSSGPRTYIPASISGYTHRKKRMSYASTQPLSSPQDSRIRTMRSLKQPARQVMGSSPTVSIRRMMTTSVSASVPLKAAQHNLPYWQVEDNAKPRATDGAPSMAISIGGRFAASEYRDLTHTTFAYSNRSVRMKAAPRPSGIKAARKTESQDDVQAPTSSSETSDSDSDESESISASENSEAEQQQEDDDSSEDDDVQIIERSLPLPVIEILDDTPPILPIQIPQPPDDLIAAVEKLSLSITCMQNIRKLPFLRRNLRRGFLNYCRIRGIKTVRASPIPSITVTFNLANSDLPPYHASISCPECPLCVLLPPLQTKAMLETHLCQDHPEVQTVWEENDEALGLILVLPNIESVIEPMPPIPSRTISPSPQVSRSHREKYGPTARFPFLPAKSEYGGPDLHYSVRFGGPKIYDLLGTLPMERYGVLAWTVLDKEEEIFESDDIPDEHKVMHALWARWIHLNRNFFIADYFEGAKGFLDEYWKMIRLAAGWDALRYWLIMLLANRYLTGKDVANLLKRYKAWCEE